MRGKCLMCENYYLKMSYQKSDGKIVNIFGCNSPDVVGMYAPGGHPFVLNAKGEDIKVLDCYSFCQGEKKKEDIT